MGSVSGPSEPDRLHSVVSLYEQFLAEYFLTASSLEAILDFNGQREMLAGSSQGPQAGTHRAQIQPSGTSRSSCCRGPSCVIHQFL